MTIIQQRILARMSCKRLTLFSVLKFRVKNGRKFLDKVGGKLKARASFKNTKVIWISMGTYLGAGWAEAGVHRPFQRNRGSVSDLGILGYTHTGTLSAHRSRSRVANSYSVVRLDIHYLQRNISFAFISSLLSINKKIGFCKQQPGEHEVKKKSQKRHFFKKRSRGLLEKP